MAEENEQQLTDAIMGDGDGDGDGGGRAGGGAVTLWIVLGGVMVLGAGGGFLASRFLGAAAAKADAAEPDRADEAPDRAPAKGGEMAYFPIPSVTINLNEERLNRHLKATISLGADPRHADEVKSLLDKRMVEVTDWLNIYLSGCTLEDVRGPKNLCRIQREIAEALNGRFWPEQKPRIERVLLNEWHVQ
ncbi:MAG TPA: flagellar basal body-associated FliL family protein [Phycisphaerae bacterium]|nr:flagellar basal body-associated FliL family protein [Phycisphaerae bacterium]